MHKLSHPYALRVTLSFLLLSICTATPQAEQLHPEQNTPYTYTSSHILPSDISLDAPTQIPLLNIQPATIPHSITTPTPLPKGVWDPKNTVKISPPTPTLTGDPDSSLLTTATIVAMETTTRRRKGKPTIHWVIISDPKDLWALSHWLQEKDEGREEKVEISPEDVEDGVAFNY